MIFVLVITPSLFVFKSGATSDFVQKKKLNIFGRTDLKINQNPFEDFKRDVFDRKALFAPTF